MTGTQTEALHDMAFGLDQRAPDDIAAILAQGQIAAAASVAPVTSDIASGASAMADTIRNGGILHYVAAGSSGLMAAADAQELGGTFSIPPEQLRIHMAGGLPTGVEMPGDTEDGTDGLREALDGLQPRDTLIAVSASGTTPFTLAAARIAKAAGTRVVAIANNAGSALLDIADYPVCLSTPPEVLSGSTRMGAGTAQKIALNMLSSLMAVRLGHVHDGMMVNLRADNIKLRARALSIVARIADVTHDAAAEALNAAQGDVKPAVLIASKGISPERANTILRETEGNLRAALARQI
ncbi:N-acetylmuramic acid 6-phosphate etherase [Primorskyibacter aestuariivivens]|uniref:N-acetylmuramic acid 6-phosphate etherase n=1 Tax=Primorskyibacter aestuariivivens TaxID=1888912 RepID=UPI0023004E2B|nr:N-acetylmuramic acid 6-phosphate etherase [Primorskyibacter aestuariivivens]MDA7429713.1 N-acetylmuramic acid 6-phosphate etherase [Primorskyibacter aestuariivivens]